MAIQGFNKEFYLNAKLAQLQSNAETAADWAGKDAAFLETRLLNGFGLTAEAHYEQYGFEEGLAPNAFFDPAEYIRAKATDMFNDPESSYLTIDQAAEDFVNLWGGNVYNHYLQFGEGENVNPSNAFDVSSYLEAKLAQLQGAEATAEEWADKDASDVAAAFEAAGITALEHFIAFGEEEGLAATPVPAEEQVAVEEGENPNQGETFNLTTGADSLQGTGLNDTFNAAPVGQIGNDANTLQQFDSIDGGAGTDTLNIYAKSNTGNTENFNVSQVGTVSNVEVINIFNTEAQGNVFANAGIDASKFEGAEQIWQIDGSTDITKLAATTTAGFRGDKDVDVDLTAANAAESVNVALDMADVAQLVAEGVDLDVSGNNLNAINLSGELTYEGTTACGDPTMLGGDVALVISGSQASVALNTVFDTNVTFATSEDLEALDASASTGDITVNGGTQLTSILTGEGADTVTTSVNTDNEGDVLVETGAGNDRIFVATSGEGVTTVNAGSGNNQVWLGYLTTSTGNIASDEVSVTAGDGNDVMMISASAFGAVEELTANLGAGNDSVTINGVLASLNSNWVIDGGEGTDKVTINVATGRDFVQGDYTALTDNLDNFEQLVLNDTASGASYTVDASRMEGYEQFGFKGTGTYNISEVEDQVITIAGGGQLNVTAVDFDDDDADNIVYGGDLTVISVADGEGENDINAEGSNLNLTVEDSGAAAKDTTTTQLTTLTGELETLNVALESTEVLSGSEGDCPEDREVEAVATSSVTVDTSSTLRNLTDITLTGQGSATITNAAGAALETVNASALSAIEWNTTDDEVVVGKGLDYTTANADVAETITLSEGRDTVTFADTTAAAAVSAEASVVAGQAETNSGSNDGVAEVQTIAVDTDSLVEGREFTLGNLNYTIAADDGVAELAAGLGNQVTVGSVLFDITADGDNLVLTANDANAAPSGVAATLTAPELLADAASTVAKTDVVEGLNLVESDETADTLDDALTDMITVEGITTFATLSDELATEVAGRDTFNLALQQVAQDSDSQYVAFHYGNDTYIYGDVAGGQNSQVDDADMLIKLTGVQDLDLLTASLNEAQA